MKYRAYTLNNFRTIPQLEKLTDRQKDDIEIVGNVLPFKVSNYVVDELIDWDNFEEDPFFILNFPQKDMLILEHFNSIKKLLEEKADRSTLNAEIDRIRLSLNPNPAGQQYNVPEFEGEPLTGIQHKYDETMLFFPSQGQTCHAYCTFCFRWPQFAMNDFRFAMKEADLMVNYLKAHPEISDVLFTGGDPGIMKTKFFEYYFNALLDADIPNLKTIRIGTKALSYWPYRFTTDDDADDLIELFEKTVKKGINISIMAHFNHPRALDTKAVSDAINRILSTGAQIRTQSPVLKHINADGEVWGKMWRKQVSMGLIPYYMFVARDTGAQDYFAITLDKAINIYNDAYTHVSGICRTVRGPSMSSDPGKIHMLGVTEVNGEKVFVMRFIQGRNPEWVNRIFFAKYNPDALWISDLEPAFGEKEFFFMKEFNDMRNSQHDLEHTEAVE
ncbi:MAG: lysine 2,3-aminomutase [Prolixibacteraceae bacterium]|jgi:KamA family protein|nr:lysine 2,3-aminomutase [Prolixibacteraceae bacterium]